MAVCTVFATLMWQAASYNGQIIQSPTLLIPDPAGNPAATCPGYVLVDPAEYATFQSQILLWNLDLNVMSLTFVGALSLWAVGLGVGHTISLIRKLRTP